MTLCPFRSNRLSSLPHLLRRNGLKKVVPGASAKLPFFLSHGIGTANEPAYLFEHLRHPVLFSIPVSISPKSATLNASRSEIQQGVSGMILCEQDGMYQQGGATEHLPASPQPSALQLLWVALLPSPRVISACTTRARS